MGGAANRAKGHNLERRIAKIFRDLGYPFAKTSRQASRLLDDSKVDIAFVPFLIQCKKGYLKGLNYTSIFLEMKQALGINFPPDDQIHKHPPIIIHDKGRKSEEKLVVMEETTFWDLIKKDEQV
tara:strand:- start:43000 stop:43371 length:372 start_codon:yes stop_codon:yes gene_type:complete